MTSSYPCPAPALHQLAMLFVALVPGWGKRSSTLNTVRGHGGVCDTTARRAPRRDASNADVPPLPPLPALAEAEWCSSA